MKYLAKRVCDALKADEANFKYLFYLPKKNEFRLVKGKYNFVPENTFHYQYYDGKIFGDYINVNKTKSWVLVGTL